MKHRPVRAAGVLAAALLAGCQPSTPTEARGTADTPAAATAVSRPPLAAVDVAEGVDGYIARATALRDALAPGGDVAALRRDAQALMELGATLVPGFVERHPHCEAYLAAALQVRSAWPALDLAAIERDYHHDGVLPKVENSGVCYHMKDLVTHPATVLVLLKDARPDFRKARREIDEVIEHAGFVARSTQS
jgi:hypothetical protein